MTERQLQLEANNRLSRGGWTWWYPPEQYFSYRGKVVIRDIFSIFDLIAIKKSRIMFVQLTTIQHLSEHRRKIRDFCFGRQVRFKNGFIWAYNPKKGEWKTERV